MYILIQMIIIVNFCVWDNSYKEWMTGLPDDWMVGV